MASAATLRLDELFFPLQKVRARPEHDHKAEHSETKLLFTHELTPVAGPPTRYALNIVLRSDASSSTNAPYHFAIDAYAVFSVHGKLNGAAARDLGMTAGMPIVVGAIRERIAELSARAPWGRLLLNLTDPDTVK